MNFSSLPEGSFNKNRLAFVGLLFFALPCVGCMENAQDKLSYLVHVPKIFFGLMIFIGAITIFRCGYDLYLIHKKKYGNRTDIFVRIFARIIAAVMAILVLAQCLDWLILYLHRQGIAILLIWLVPTALFVLIANKISKKATLLILPVHHLFLLIPLIIWLPKLPDYRLHFGMLITLIVAVNLLIVFRKKLPAALAGRKLFWLSGIFFVAVAFGSFLNHASLEIAKKPPRFAPVYVVPGTQGRDVQSIAVSPNGAYLYFTNVDGKDGLHKVGLGSDVVDTTNQGLQGFGKIVRIPDSNFMAMAGQRNGKAVISLSEMDPYRHIGIFSPTADIAYMSEIADVDATERRIFATVNSPDHGPHLIGCTVPTKEEATEGNLLVSCNAVKLNSEKAGNLTTSPYMKRTFACNKSEPFGIANTLHEFMAAQPIFTRTIEVGRGLLDIILEDHAYTFYIGRPFTKGIEVGNPDSMDLRRVLDGPVSISTLYSYKALLAGGSYTEGEVVVHNIHSHKSARIFVGPRVRQIDYSPIHNALFIATGIGVMRVDLDWFFEGQNWEKQ